MNKLIYLLLISGLVFGQSITNSQIEKIKSELQKDLINNNPSQDVVIEDNQPLDKVKILVEPSQNRLTSPEYFGYDYLERDLNFYDNLAPSSNYILGPGDEVIISMWGETNNRETFIINKDGLIYFENVGFINISNLNISDAEKLLRERLSEIYSTLNNKDNPTNLRVELGKIKSINVFFTGEVNNPGISIIHPFSDILTALIQAGGVQKTGSLRNIKLIRANKVVATIDFYNFFNFGIKEFENLPITNGDIIHIPFVEKRVKIEGEVNRPKLYELKNKETLSDLITFAGGLKSSSSAKALIKEIAGLSSRVSDDFAKYGRSVNLIDAKEIVLTNGAEIFVLPIADNDFEVTVHGKVNFPGDYPISNDSNLKNLLDVAGGFNDPIFRKSIEDGITILRLDENQFFSKEFFVDYADAENFKLKANDQIFVYENQNYLNDQMFSVVGEVNKSGTFPLKTNTTLGAALELAGGINEMGSLESISIDRNFKSFDELGNELIETKKIGNINLDFVLSDKDVINVSSLNNVVKVDGNVYSPGLVAFSKRMNMSKAIELAGGYKPNSLKNRSYVIRSNGEIEKANLFRGRAKRVFPGDTIFVPVNTDPNEFDITQFIADLSTTLANIAAILILVDNQAD